MDGIINVYKPIGITSFDVIRDIKKITGIKKIGHTGTLDPLASGVLPICIGKATKAVDFIMSGFKTYKAELKLGVVTDTYDREGKILETNKVNVSEEEIIKCINSFKGDILQVPPMYSAIKVNGKKLYELARKGIEVELEPRLIKIFDIEILEIKIPYVTFNVKCSKGTYIRSLCYDIGKNLNCGATMWNLERIQSGNFSKNSSVKLEDLNKDTIEKFLIPIDEVFSYYDRIEVNPKAEKLLVNGVCIGDKNLLPNIDNNTMYRIYNNNGIFIGIGLKSKNGLKIEKLFL